MRVYRLNFIQNYLNKHKLNGWLIYDYKGRNIFLSKLLPELENKNITRKVFLWIPVKGNPTLLIHRTEGINFTDFEGKIKYYYSRESMINCLRALLKSHYIILMEYSRLGNLPEISLIDAGTYRLVRRLVRDIRSSASLVQMLFAMISEEQYKSHLEAVDKIHSILDLMGKHLNKILKDKQKITEFELTNWIHDRYNEFGLVSDFPPIVAYGPNTSNPHYFPVKEKSLEIIPSNPLLIDIFAKINKPNSIYADITWMFWIGKYEGGVAEFLFNLVIQTRDLVVNYIKEKWKANEKITGKSVDRYARSIVIAQGCDQYFVHRTGHNIHTSVHGWGVNFDGYESIDNRLVLPNMLFSIEPGLYTSNLGVRSEINLFIHPEKGPIVTTPIQHNWSFIAE